MTSEMTINKVIISRNDTIRSVFGGYGRLLNDDGTLGECVYIRKGTAFTVVSFNLYTQTILAVNQETKQTYSLEYDYVLERCRCANTRKNTVIDSIAIISVRQPVSEGKNWIAIATLILAALSNLFFLLALVL